MDNLRPFSPSNSFQARLKCYQESLKSLKETNNFPSEEQVLEILSARDALKDALGDRQQVPDKIKFQIMDLDSQLKKYAYKITKVLDLAAYRTSFPTPVEDWNWWWHLETTGDPHPHERWDWLCKGLRVGVWTGNLALLVAIVNRFISAGTGLGGAFGVVIPSILTLLNARSELTETGREGFVKLMAKWGISPHWQEEAKLTSTCALFTLLLFFWFQFLPLISVLYNNQGKRNYDRGKLGAAEENYLRAIALNSDTLEAYYNLGNLYEDLQKFDDARQNYLIAAQGNMPEAYNNLAYLSIQVKDYPQAIFWLQKGILLLKKSKESKPNVAYSLSKNLGWARFEQERYNEAQQALKQAISVLSPVSDSQEVLNKGSASCLLAQVLEKQEKREALEQWQNCYKVVSSEEVASPEEDSWLHLACQKLQEAGKPCQNP